MRVFNKSQKIRVGVLRGGPSGEYEVSIRTGQNIIDALKSRPEYGVHDILIDRSGAWHIDGIARPADRVFPHADVFVNALHGLYGEDGQVQRLMEAHNVPYTGSTSLGSALGMNKSIAKKYFKRHGILTPEHVVVNKNEHNLELAEKIRNKYPHLRLVKPTSSGSSLGISIINSVEELNNALVQALEHSDSALVEEFIRGREATCGVIESSQSGHVYTLEPVEIRNLSKKNKDDIWSYESKYSDDLHELICPGNFTPEEVRQIKEAAVAVHNALGLRHYSRSDFIVSRNGIYILEVNTLPGLTSTSLFPRALSVAGISVTDFIDHIIKLALLKTNR